MRPEDKQQSGRVGTPQSSAARSYIHTPPSRDPQYRQQEAAANIVRAQIDTIFASDSPSGGEATSTQAGSQNHDTQSTASSNLVTPPSQRPRQSPVQPPSQQEQQQPDLTPQSPYERTHTPQTAIQAEQWKQYHSAWQDYYKRYYEGYYTQQIASAKQSIEASTATGAARPSEATGDARLTEETSSPQRDGPVTRKQAMQDLKARLLTQVEESAKKARRSRHFIPVIATVGVLLIFGFLQYNQVIIANVKAYVTPGSIDPQNIIVDYEDDVKVDKKSRLIIPKINVDTPVFYDISTKKSAQDKAMENGVAHFAIPGANSHPGEIGNTVLSGHSSNDVFAAGDYKFIFMQLDKLQVGDTIYANYKGTRYTYVVTKKREVSPTNVKALTYDTDKPEMTLITCTPLGTALRRLLVTAEQVYPTTHKPAPESSSSENTTTTIPGTEGSTPLERIFSR